MKRIAIVGAVGAGKTTLFNALQGNYSLARKTQALEFNDRGDIDTPGEYFSHPRWYHALMNPLMILVKIIKLRWIHILSYDQMVSRKIN
ncbi:EutP/PduV family microcompartment system protein, partial [Klebsiella pneumoniae]|uniref:EutP/PduV family microcompartment system protein n=1 Tax=Klebsiella pneumoniae TaxID=573 RepID=UPI000AE7789D